MKKYSERVEIILLVSNSKYKNDRLPFTIFMHDIS